MSVIASGLGKLGQLRARGLQCDVIGFELYERCLEHLGAIGDGAAPVVIQGGLSSRPIHYEPLQRILRARGFDVSIVSLPVHGWGTVQDDAEALRRVVERVCRRSGADHVSIIGHSKGGISARWYLQRMGGVDRVAQLTTLASPHNGVAPLDGRLPLDRIADRFPVPVPPILRQLIAGSSVLDLLAADLDAFMERVRSRSPEFQLTSIAGSLGNGTVRALRTDGVVSVAAARIAEVDPAIRNIVITTGPRSHYAVAAQGRVSEIALRHVLELAARASRVRMDRSAACERASTTPASRESSEDGASSSTDAA